MLPWHLSRQGGVPVTPEVVAVPWHAVRGEGGILACEPDRVVPRGGRFGKQSFRGKELSYGRHTRRCERTCCLEDLNVAGASAEIAGKPSLESVLSPFLVLETILGTPQGVSGIIQILPSFTQSVSSKQTTAVAMIPTASRPRFGLTALPSSTTVPWVRFDR